MAKSQRQEPAIGTVIARRRERLIQRRELLLLIRRIMFLGLAGWVLFTQIFMFVKVQGMEMFPALKDGDLAIVFRLQKDYAAEDVVIYEADGDRHIGRIVACEHDVVTIDDSGTLMVNGTVKSGEILYSTYAREENSGSERVPENGVYVLGDYRTQSRDSRDFGTIPLENVQGKVITILRRRGI